MQMLPERHNPKWQIVTDTKLNVSVARLFTKDNTRLLQQLKSGFKIIFYWDKYISKEPYKAKIHWKF